MDNSTRLTAPPSGDFESPPIQGTPPGQATAPKFTLEPYKLPRENDQNERWTKVVNKNKIINKRRKEKRIRMLLNTFQEDQKLPNFPKYYKVTFPRMDIESELNLIRTDQEIKRKIGLPRKIF